MNIVFIADENKIDLLTDFSIAYTGILSRHYLYSISPVGQILANATGLNVRCFLSCVLGGTEQIAKHILYNEIDMLIYLKDPNKKAMNDDVSYLSGLCDKNNVPFASNIATAETLILGLTHGDLKWRNIINPGLRKVLI